MNASTLKLRILARSLVLTVVLSAGVIDQSDVRGVFRCYKYCRAEQNDQPSAQYLCGSREEGCASGLFLVQKG